MDVVGLSSFLRKDSHLLNLRSLSAEEDSLISFAFPCQITIDTPCSHRTHWDLAGIQSCLEIDGVSTKGSLLLHLVLSAGDDRIRIEVHYSSFLDGDVSCLLSIYKNYAARE